jgi:hypothetical protein
MGCENPVRSRTAPRGLTVALHRVAAALRVISRSAIGIADAEDRSVLLAEPVGAKPSRGFSPTPPSSNAFLWPRFRLRLMGERPFSSGRLKPGTSGEMSSTEACETDSLPFLIV